MSDPGRADRPRRIAVFVKNGENPNYQAFLLGAERAAAAAGAVAERHVPATPDSAEEQTALKPSFVHTVNRRVRSRQWPPRCGC